MNSRDVIRLRLLGVPQLEGSGQDVSAVLAQPKRLALLAWLAVRHDWVQRDHLLGLFWNDLDEERARRALSQALHFLRTNLGEGSICARGSNEVRAGAGLWCDVGAFEAASAAKNWEGALELFRGDLLQGMSGVPSTDFEHWLDFHRSRLRRLAGEAAASRSEECFRAGDLNDALTWQRRAYGLRPLDEATLRSYLMLLDETGDAATALAEFDAFRVRLASEYEIEPARETVKVIDQIRARRPEILRRDRQVAGPPPAPLTGQAVDSLVVPATPDEAASWTRYLWEKGRKREGRPIVLAGGIALAAIAWMVSGAKPAGLKDARNWPANRVAVEFFDVRGDTSKLGAFADQLTEEIIEHLSKIKQLNVVSSRGVRPFRRQNAPLDTIGARTRARTLISGSVTEADGTKRIYVQLQNTATGLVIGGKYFDVKDGDSGFFPVIDSLMDEISIELRQELGQAIQLNRWESGTGSREAWDLVAQAHEYDASFESYLFTDVKVAEDAIAEADRKLQRAITLDRNWILPHIVRSRLAWSMAWLCGKKCPPDETVEWLSRAVQYTNDGLALEPENPQALELRARIEYNQVLMGFSQDTTLLDRALKDATKAAGKDPTMAGAWSTMSSVMADRGDLEHAQAYAENAYNADAFLADRNTILNRLFETAFDQGRDSAAAAWCERMQSLPGARWQAASCALNLMAWARNGQPDPVRAANIVRNATTKLEDPADSAMARGLDLQLAAVEAAAGRRDAAERRLKQEQMRPHRDELIPQSAAVQVLLHCPEEARSALIDYMRDVPQTRLYLMRKRWFASLQLREEDLNRPADTSGNAVH